MIMKKILLIGSEGYIGSRFNFEFENKYIISKVDLLIHKQNQKENVIKECFSELNEEYINSHDVIILLAGHSSVGMCKGPILPVIQNNFINFVKLVEKIHSDKKLIFASSSSVYGMHYHNEAKENCKLQPAIDNYDLSKQILDIFQNFIKCNWYSLRFGTVNGWSPNFRTDIMINGMHTNYKKNNNIKISNIKINRPILGIKDLCLAVDRIIDSNENNSGIYNLCSFNSTPEIIGKNVSKYLNCELIIDKRKTFSYNFKISSSKFIKKFNFKFNETIETILSEIETNYDKIEIFGGRNEYCGMDFKK
jgi:nucleoside-diphosphate-sugar epimerase